MGGLVTLLAVLVFVASLVSAGAVFGYQELLNRSLVAKKDSLAKYQAAYDLSTIQTLARFDSRITEARTLLTQHTAASGVFFFLSQQTLEQVQFKDFEYTLQNDGTAKIQLQGVANSFNTVALQSDQFGASKVLKDVIFSDLAIGEGGDVTFSVSATVDPSIILYSKNLNATIPVINEQVQPAVEATSTPATSTQQ